MSGPEPMVVVRDLCHAYDVVPVLVDVSFELCPGERTFVIGANGAGKSTLAYVLAGLVRPVSGSVRFAGEDVTGQPAHAMARRGLSYTPAYRSVFPFLTVRENLELAGDVMAPHRGVPRDIFVPGRMEYVLSIFPGLRTHLRRAAGQLSGGLQRMVEIGRALMGDPRLLILDEPTLGLAGGVLADLSDGLVHLADHVTLLIIEQNVPFAAGLCERGYLMGDGRIALHGTADELLESPLVRKTYLGVI